MEFMILLYRRWNTCTLGVLVSKNKGAGVVVREERFCENCVEGVATVDGEVGGCSTLKDVVCQR